jgi:hypothetical protein
VRGELLLAALALAWGGTARAAPCAWTVPVLDAGREAGRICPELAPAAGLTVVDLSDTWAPRILRGTPYESTYVALANETPGEGHEWDRARDERHLELYGIPPNLGVVATRLLDGARHACHAAAGAWAFTGIERNLRLPLAPAPALALLEQRLVCDGLLPRSQKTRPAWRLETALAAYQRKHTVVARGVLDGETARAFAADPRELHFRALLRALRARVVDATGLLEDGTALGARGVVLGRRLDGEAFYRAATRPLENGVPDLVSPATEVAALALGWTDAGAAAAFLRARDTRSLVVALRLPPPPAYHAAHMELAAEIDRGDVWYDVPGKRGRVQTSPTLTLYARLPGGAQLALVRWPTTIGGWKKELLSGGRVALRYKDSDVGPRVWRDLVASPAWLPPPTTPPRTLVRRVAGGRWIADGDIVGPGYASAFGLVMLVHHEVVPRAKGRTSFLDNGIRTHGTVSYTSILRGESHGCHRLFNQSAVQLASFLLAHREHTRRGVVSRPYLRPVWWQGRRLVIPIPHRGFVFELTPPVPVNVLEGTIRGRFRKPPGHLVRVK